MMNDNENNLFAKLAFGDLSEVQALLKSGVNLDEHKNEHGETALHNTLFTGYMDRAELLLKNNANPNIKDNNGETILHSVIMHNSIEKIEFLFQNATNIDLEVKNSFGFTPLYTAVVNKNIKTAELLLKHGANPDSKDKYGFSILCSAINNNNIEIIELLLKNGANPNIKDNNECSLLYCPVFNKIEAAKLLIKYGADVNVGSDKNFTPLDSAIIDQQKELAELLLKNGADIIANHTHDTLHGKIIQLLNINVSEAVIANSLLTSNTIQDSIKFNALSSMSCFTKDVHRKVIDNNFKDVIKEWSNNGITEENFHNNKFKDIIKTYKKYKDFAIDYGAPCPAFEDYNTQSTTVFIPPTLSDFAQEVDGLYNTHHKINSLSYFAFKKLLSSSNNLEIIQDNNIALSTSAKDTEQQLHIKYNIKKQEVESVYFYARTPDLTEITWDYNNSQSILSNLFETELTGDIA